MIPDEKLTSRADAFVKAHQGDDDLNPDLASAMATYQAQRDQGAELGTQVHARALLRRAEGLGYDLSKTQPAKKTAKKTAKKSTSRRRS